MLRQVHYVATQYVVPSLRDQYASVTNALRRLAERAAVVAGSAPSREVAMAVVERVNRVLDAYNGIAEYVQYMDPMYADGERGATWHLPSVRADLAAIHHRILAATTAINQMQAQPARSRWSSALVSRAASSIDTAEAEAPLLPRPLPRGDGAPAPAAAASNAGTRTVPATQVPAQRSSGMLWAWAFMLGGGALIFLGMTKKARR